MQNLVRILGQPVESESVRSSLSGYSAFVAEEQDLAPDEGMPRDFYLLNVAAGICIEHEATGEITTVFLFSEGHEGYSQYAGDLGNGLSFSSGQDALRRALGAPSFYRQEGSIPGLGKYGQILRYDYSTHSVHFQFSVGGTRLELVTLMVPKAVPRVRANEA